ncbi:MAG: hemolysin family protein [Actinomycetes bacterium]
MSADDGWLLVLAVLLVGGAGLASAAEAALVVTGRSYADEAARSGRRGGTRLATITADSPRYLNVVLLIRVACELLATVLVTTVALDLTRHRRPEAVGLAAVAMVLVSYVVVGVGPRTLGRQHAGAVALAAAGPVVALTRVLGPLPALLIALGNALTPGRGYRQGPFTTEADLRDLVDLAGENSLIEAGERQMIHSVFDLGDTLVREVMVPRTDMVVLERTRTLRQALSLHLRTGFSRIPVVGGGTDDVVGVAYLRDLVRRIFEYRESEATERVESQMRPATFVPETKPVDDLLREMQAARIHLAIVVDEYGGTAGLVTIEDIVEEVVGEISDEYDHEIAPVERLPDGSVRVSTRLGVDDFAELFGVSIPDDDVDTVGGLVAKRLGRVPIPGAQAQVEGLLIRAEGPTGRRNRVATWLVTTSATTAPAVGGNGDDVEHVDV